MRDWLNFDKKLWFELHDDHCDGKHYILGNPHTFTGRIFAYCPQKDAFFNISLKEIKEMPTETEYWIKGFISGNEPSRPVDEEGIPLDPPSQDYIHWEESVELFHKTGYWYPGERHCEICGVKLLNSWTEFDCENCLNKK